MILRLIEENYKAERYIKIDELEIVKVEKEGNVERQVKYISRHTGVMQSCVVGEPSSYIVELWNDSLTSVIYHMEPYKKEKAK